MRLDNDIYLRSAFKELEAFAIPGVGTFRKVYRSASTDELAEKVFPPMVGIEFKEEVEESLLLTHYLTEEVHMDKDSAAGLVNKISQEMLQALQTEDHLEIVEIGQLQKCASGKLEFGYTDHKPYQFFKDYYGFQPVSFSPVSKGRVEETSVTMDVSTNVNPYQRRRTSGWRPVALMGAFLVFGSSVVFLYLKGKRLERSTLAMGVKTPDDRQIAEEVPLLVPELLPEASTEAPAATEKDIAENTTPPVQPQTEKPAVVTTPKVDRPIAAADPIETPSQETPSAVPASPANVRSVPPANGNMGVPRGGQTQEITDISMLDTLPADPTTTDAISRKSTPTPPASKRAYTFHVISGSFSSLQSAQRSVSEWKRKGFPLSQVVSPKGASTNYRVSVYNAATKPQADAFAARMKRQGKGEPWVFRRSN